MKNEKSEEDDDEARNRAATQIQAIIRGRYVRKLLLASFESFSEICSDITSEILAFDPSCDYNYDLTWSKKEVEDEEKNKSLDNYKYSTTDVLLKMLKDFAHGDRIGNELLFATVSKSKKLDMKINREKKLNELKQKRKENLKNIITEAKWIEETLSNRIKYLSQTKSNSVVKDIC